MKDLYEVGLFPWRGERVAGLWGNRGLQNLIWPVGSWSLLEIFVGRDRSIRSRVAQELSSRPTEASFLEAVVQVHGS